MAGKIRFPGAKWLDSRISLRSKQPARRNKNRVALLANWLHSAMPAKARPSWWIKVDWGLTNIEIARRAKVDPHAVQQKRLELGLPARRRGKPIGKHRVDLSRVDWTRQDVQIAQELGITPQAVWQHRQTLGKQREARRPKEETIDWSALDWSQTNTRLARETGVGKNVVARQRQRCGSLPVRGGAPRKYLGDPAQLDWTKHDGQLAAELRLSRTTVCAYRRKLGIPAVPRKPRPPLDPEIFDWTKSNTALARALHLHKATVARCRQQAGAPPVPRGAPPKASTLKSEPKIPRTFTGCLVLVIPANSPAYVRVLG